MSAERERNPGPAKAHWPPWSHLVYFPEIASHSGVAPPSHEREWHWSECECLISCSGAGLCSELYKSIIPACSQLLLTGLCTHLQQHDNMRPVVRMSAAVSGPTHLLITPSPPDTWLARGNLRRNSSLGWGDHYWWPGHYRAPHRVWCSFKSELELGRRSGPWPGSVSEANLSRCTRHIQWHSRNILGFPFP